MKRIICLFIVSIFVFSLANCVALHKFDAGPYYVAHNIWYENPQAVYAINFKRGVMIPAGTRVSNIKQHRYVDGGLRAGYYSGGMAIQFYAEDFGWINFIALFRWQPGLSLKDFAKRTFSHSTFSQLVAGLSQEEIELIQKGEVKIGMSRKAVEISYGFPPRHYTPALTNRAWRYWLSRNSQQMIVFDENWKISQITD